MIYSINCQNKLYTTFYYKESVLYFIDLQSHLF